MIPGATPLLAPDPIRRARAFGERTALVTRSGSFPYRALFGAAAGVASRLGAGVRGEPVAMALPPGAEYVAAQWGIWMAGGIAMPVGMHSPAAEIATLVRVSGARYGVGDGDGASRLRAVELAHVLECDATERAAAPGTELAAPDEASPALLLFTSGTTGAPKGVPLTHANLSAQIRSLSVAWGWTGADRILGVLPLHHVHGIVNVLASSLWNGAVCELPSRFEPIDVWRRFSAGGPTLFMAVPTIYRLLLDALTAADASTRASWARGAATLRLMVSGSAPLSSALREEWRAATGQDLLERYGMTEIGMALSQPLHGLRRAGTVGAPLPGVDVRLVDETGRASPDGEPGEIEVRGPGVFPGYWRNEAATREAFRDGWFRTGDLAVREAGEYRILGRMSQDILKSGGYKLSALEIEAALLEHTDVAECAVVGIPDPTWGESIAAAVVARAGRSVDAEELRAWLRGRMAPYKVPRLLRLMDSLPRNAMGKVSKNELRERLRAAGGTRS